MGFEGGRNDCLLDCLFAGEIGRYFFGRHGELSFGETLVRTSQACREFWGMKLREIAHAKGAVK